MVANAAPPCPQAARSAGYVAIPPAPWENIVTDEPVLPLQFPVADALPAALVDQSIRWPYHAPSFNGVDCLWWAMLMRAAYSADQTWMARVAGWAQPIVRTQFTDRFQPARQGRVFVELQDCVLVVIPGTSSEAEALSYFLSHSLRQIHTSPAGWQINSTWAARGEQVVAAYNAWPPPNPFKPVIVVGHSSGGAYGAYFMYTKYSDSQHPYTLATYGAPIWGTHTLVDAYNDGGQLPKTIDFALANDIVPIIPPPWAAVDLLFPLAYALNNRPTYRRVNTLLTLGGSGGPVPAGGAATLETIVHAARTLVTGGSIEGAHAPASYTAAADHWAANDPSIVREGLRPAYDALKTILADMNTAGLY